MQDSDLRNLLIPNQALYQAELMSGTNDGCQYLKDYHHILPVFKERFPYLKPFREDGGTRTRDP